MVSPATVHSVDAASFLSDRHAAKYRDILDAHPAAFARVLALLDDPLQSRRLEEAERMGHAALQGVVRALEGDPLISACLAGQGSTRFRQAVGVAVRLRMEALGWAGTGRKGAIRGSEYFTRAERYRSPLTGNDDCQTERALAALDAVAEIGGEAERRSTGDELMAALAASRQAEGRPF